MTGKGTPEISMFRRAMKFSNFKKIYDNHLALFLKHTSNDNSRTKSNKNVFSLPFEWHTLQMPKGKKKAF